VTNHSEVEDEADPQDLIAIAMLEKAILEEINFRVSLEAELNSLKQIVLLLKRKKEMTSTKA